MASFSYFERIDNRFIRHIKPEFDLSRSISNEALLIRLLVGTVGVTNIYSSDSFDQFYNYSILGKPLNSPVSSSPITNCLEPNYTLAKVCHHLVQTRFINHSFFLQLLEEITSYFYKKSKASFTAGFLHLYRALEYISYSFPMIYASISREYHGSFNKLKEYFENSKNELTFFDEFTKKILDTGLLQTPLTFNFNTLSPDINRNHFQIIKGILTPANIHNEVANVSITTTYQHLLKLTIDIRNRYFHFAVGGQRNIRSTDIIENDIFFNIINEELVNWISIIYFNILATSVDKF